MQTKFKFSSWGQGKFAAPAYAMVSHDAYSISGAIAAAIARKSKLNVATIRRDGTILPEEHPQYQMTLGTPFKGGYIPKAEVWFTYDPDQGSEDWWKARNEFFDAVDAAIDAAD